MAVCLLIDIPGGELEQYDVVMRRCGRFGGSGPDRSPYRRPERRPCRRPERRAYLLEDWRRFPSTSGPRSGRLPDAALVLRVAPISGGRGHTRARVAQIAHARPGAGISSRPDFDAVSFAGRTPV